jgi:hypothetical protein
MLGNRFLLPSIPPIPSRSSSMIIQGWYNSPVIGLSNSGLCSAPPQECKRKKKKKDTQNILQLQIMIYKSF